MNWDGNPRRFLAWKLQHTLWLKNQPPFFRGYFETNDLTVQSAPSNCAANSVLLASVVRDQNWPAAVFVVCEAMCHPPL